MPMPRLDYQRPDYTDRISGGLSALGKEVEANSPAPEIVQKYLRMAMSGRMSPQEAARRAQAEHHLSGMGAPQQAPQASAPQMPAPGPWQGGYDAGPAPGGGFTGPREFTGEETVTAPSQAPSPQLADLPEDNLPIRNKDVPTLIQVGGMSNKAQGNDLSYLNYLLGRDRLGETVTNRLSMQPGRDARTEATRAATANIPFKNRMAEGNLGARWASVATGQGNLAARENESYLKGTNDVAAPIAQIKGLLSAAAVNPAILPPAGDYRVRKEADIVDSIYGGKPLAGLMRVVADAELTPDQRTFRRQAKQLVMPFQHMMVGSQITAGEMEMVNMIAGQQLSPEDTAAGLSALSQTMQARLNRYKAGYPAAAQRIPDVAPQDVTPQFSPPEYPTGFGPQPSLPQLPGEDSSLQDELNNSILNRGGR